MNNEEQMTELEIQRRLEQLGHFDISFDYRAVTMANLMNSYIQKLFEDLDIA